MTAEFRVSRPLFFILALFLPLMAAGQTAPPSAAEPASSRFHRFEKIGDMIKLWHPQQHLYVQGNLGPAVTDSQLNELEDWLRNRGHWTVILMQDAQPQRYVNEDGRVENGMDAVELSVSDLMQVGSFREQVHPQTGEPDAAVFILFLNQRRFSYYASAAQQRRELGQDRWIGTLDRPAYRAMRGGGRVLDAVRDTVNFVNERLENAIDEEYQQIQNQKNREARQTQFLQTLTFAIFGALGLGVPGALFWLNRRRLPAKQRAEKELQSLRSEVKNAMGGIEDLVERADLVIGDQQAIQRKGYQGQTKKLSEQALQGIDNLLVMSNSVDKVIDDARSKIEPDSWIGSIANQFSSGRFNQGYELLANQEIEFTDKDGISIVQKSLAELAKKDVPAAVDSPQSAAMALNFKQLFQVFQSELQSVHGAIDRVESAWTQIVATNADLQKQIDDAYHNEQLARDATERDGLLDVPEIFDHLIASAQHDQDQSESIGKHDPVTAMAGPAATGMRKAKNAAELTKAFMNVRQKMIPGIRRDALQLDQRDRQVEWIDAAMDDFEERARQIASQAIESDVTVSIQEWLVSFEKFSAATAQSVQLHDQVKQEVDQAIQTSENDTALAKQKISSHLKVEPNRVLVETEYNADRMNTTAREHQAAALAALDRGDPAASQLSIAESFEWVNNATATVARSLQILNELPQETKLLFNSWGNLLGEMPRHRQQAEDLQQQFQSSALVVEDVWLEDFPANNQQDKENAVAIIDFQSIVASQLIREVDQKLNEREPLQTEIDELYQAGQLIAAESLKSTCQGILQQCEHNLKQLSGHGRQLTEFAQQNRRELEQVSTDRDKLASALQQHYVTQKTIQAAEEARIHLQTVANRIQSPNLRNPAAEKIDLEKCSDQLDEIRNQMVGDQAMFAEAKRSIESIASLLNTANRFATVAQTDRIADSRQIQSALQRIDQVQSVHQRLESQIRQPHADWWAIDHDADAAVSQAADALASLQSELDKAERAAFAIDQAAQETRAAVHWSGDFGVRANVGGLRSELDRARRALFDGNYDLANQLARRAAQAASNAIRVAENEVQRRRSERRRRAEQARRQRMRRSSHRSGSILSTHFPSTGNRRRSVPTASPSRRPRISTPPPKSSRPKSSGSSGTSGRGGFGRSGW